MILYQDCSSRLDLSKTWPPGGRSYFSCICIYIENFKNLLGRNQWTDFNITWKECVFGHPLPRLFKPSWFVKKYGCKGVGLIFPIYLYRKLEKKSSCFPSISKYKNFKNLLVRNHWTDFNTTWQECSFGDPLPSLLKLSWFIEKHGR